MKPVKPGLNSIRFDVSNTRFKKQKKNCDWFKCSNSSLQLFFDLKTKKKGIHLKKIVLSICTTILSIWITFYFNSNLLFQKLSFMLLVGCHHNQIQKASWFQKDFPQQARIEIKIFKFFSEELKTPQFTFKINWPLCRQFVLKMWMK